MALEFIWLLALTLGPVLPVGVCLLLRRGGGLGPGGIIASNRGLDQLEFLLLRLAGGLALVGAGVLVQADVALVIAFAAIDAQHRALFQQAHEATCIGAGHAHALIDRAARQIQVGAIGFEPT